VTLFNPVTHTLTHNSLLTPYNQVSDYKLLNNEPHKLTLSYWIKKALLDFFEQMTAYVSTLSDHIWSGDDLNL